MRRIRPPGVQLNMVLKKGSKHSARQRAVLLRERGLQATNIPDDLVAALGSTGGKGNRTDVCQDYGGDLRRASRSRTRLWAWGSIGQHRRHQILTLDRRRPIARS